MPSPNRGSALWPVLLGMGLLLGGALALEAAGRAKEDRGEVIVISAGSAVGPADSVGEDALLLGEPLDESHAQARRLVRRGQYGKAESIFDSLLEKYGQKPELLSELGYLQLVSGHSHVAEGTLRKARELSPGSAWLALTLATATKRNRKFSEAEELYRAALTLRPHYSAAKLALGRFFRQQGRVAEALPLLEEIANTGGNADRAAALAELGRDYLELGEAHKARKAFDKAIGRAPASVAIRITIARSYMDLGAKDDLVRATEVLQRAIQLAPAAAQLQGLLGEIMVKRGDVAAGRAAFEKSLDLDPKYAFARRKLLRLDLKAGDFFRSRAHAALLLAADKKNPEYHFLAALVEARDGKLEAARVAYTKAIALADGGYPEAHMNLGNLERRAKNYDKAIEHYRKALNLRAGYKEARNNLGLALLAAGRGPDAVREFESLLAEKPKYAEAWLNLAKAHSSAKRYPEALAALKKALAVRPGYASAQLNLASILRKSGKPSEAVAVYDKILEKQPRYVSAWYNRGIALEDAGDTEKARASYHHALKLASNHRLSMKRLARLELGAGNFKLAETLYTEMLDRDTSDAKSRRLRAEARAGQGDGAGCLGDATAAQKQDPGNSNLERLFIICNKTGEL